jgi:hypothetical protein
MNYLRRKILALIIIIEFITLEDVQRAIQSA